MIFNPRISKVNTIIKNQQLVNDKKLNKLSEPENYYNEIMEKEQLKTFSVKKANKQKIVHRQAPRLTEEFIKEDVKYNDDPFNALNIRLKLLDKKYNE